VAATIPWRAGEWTRPPAVVVEGAGQTLQVQAEAGSDAWRETYYGFVRDSAHALLILAKRSAAYQVTFGLDFTGLYEQAGLLITRDAEHWIKAGVEITDGAPHAGAVVATPTGSDWSVAPVPHWAGGLVTVRVSLDRGAVIVRARAGDGGWQFLRLAPLPSGGALRVGPYVCAPEGPGPTVTFAGFQEGPPDPGLHLNEEEGPA